MIPGSTNAFDLDNAIRIVHLITTFAFALAWIIERYRNIRMDGMYRGVVTEVMRKTGDMLGQSGKEMENATEHAKAATKRITELNKAICNANDETNRLLQYIGRLKRAYKHSRKQCWHWYGSFRVEDASARQQKVLLQAQIDEAKNQQFIDLQEIKTMNNELLK